MVKPDKTARDQRDISRSGLNDGQARKTARQLTHKEIDNIVADLAKYMVHLSVLNDLIIKYLLGEPGKSEEALKNFLNAIRKQTNQSLIESVRIQARDNNPSRQGDKLGTIISPFYAYVFCTWNHLWVYFDLVAMLLKGKIRNN